MGASALVPNGSGYIVHFRLSFQRNLRSYRIDFNHETSIDIDTDIDNIFLKLPLPTLTLIFGFRLPHFHN
jgi:hypothetical protein